MSARELYAMAKDKLFFKQAAFIHPTYHTRHVALVLQALQSIVLVWSGSFGQLTDMLVFASFIYYGCTSLGVIILRIKSPEIERKYREIGYPLLPVLFCIFCIALFFVTIINQP
jgi:basic amino acid/polyamine antiporter, APA family